MILKGNQRGNGADLATHLMNAFDNESVEVAQVHGAVADDLHGAFAEFEVISRGTRAKEYLYSVSISPPQKLTREQYFEAIGMIEERLRLSGQPRAVVFHVKDGREHAHVVWSRIDTARMRAVHMAHDRRRLMDVAVELSRKYGLDMPDGLQAWEAKQKYEKQRLEPTLAERAQEQATGITPEQRRAEITAAYEASDSAEAFRAALEQKGYVLARGDRRGLVVVDKLGSPHSLTRYIKGHKASAVKKKLAPLTPDQLPSVDQAKEQMRQRMQAQADLSAESAANEERREQERKKEQHETAPDRERERLEALRRQKEEALARKQAARRLSLAQAEQEMLTRHQAERLALHAAQQSESRGFLFRVRSAVSDLIGRAPGLRSVLGPIQKMSGLDPRDRHRLEDHALARRHAREKRAMEGRKRKLALVETRERLSREKALRREQRLQAEARLERERAAEQARSMDNVAMQDFYDAARDQGLWKEREFRDGELSEGFNDAAGFDEGSAGGGDDDAGYVPEHDDDADDDRHDDHDDEGDDDGPRHRRKRGRGFGYRRGDD